MERLRDELIAARVFEDPDADFTGINRGGQPAGVRCQVGSQPHQLYETQSEVCPLDAYNQHIINNPPATYEDYKQLLCKHYLGLYIHTLDTHPDDFPKWLYHCVPKVVLQ